MFFLFIFFFFFQAEDGIRDADVTGVQTCALPIYEFEVENLAFQQMVFLQILFCQFSLPSILLFLQRSLDFHPSVSGLLASLNLVWVLDKNHNKTSRPLSD